MKTAIFIIALLLCTTAVLAVDNGSILVSSTPSGATILVDGSPTGQLTGSSPVNLSLPTGTYTIGLSLAGYATNLTDISVTSGIAVSHDVTLRSLQGRLIVISNPLGAEVFVNGVSHGLAPINETMNPATRNVVVRLAGYDNFEQNVTLVADQTTTVLATLNPSATALLISSTPTGAQVFVDGVASGSTPSSGHLTVAVAAGTHEVTFAKSGYVNATQNVTLTTGASIAVAATLSAIPSTPANATLTIISTPAATISVDGVAVGASPITLSVAAGTHTIAAAASGYTTNQTTVNLLANETRNVSFTLSAASGIPVLTGATTSNITGGALVETNTAHFTVQYDQPVQISWYIDGVASTTAQDVVSSTLDWNPGVTFTDSSKAVTVTASANGQYNTTFNVNVINDLNPFWENDVLGADGGTITVITNNNVREYTNMTMVLTDKNGPFTVVIPREFVGPSETKWTLPLPSLSTGNTFITRIILVNDQTNYSSDVTVGGSLAHYRTEPSSGSSSTKKKTGGGGGAAPAFKNEQNKAIKQEIKANTTNTAPEFIYAVFSKDVVPVGEALTLSLDAKDNEEVASATAILRNDNGNTISVPLKLTSGSKGYGTWTSQQLNYSAGKYTLSQVRLMDDRNKSATYNVTDRAFYVLGEEVKQSEETVLVYAVLDKNTIDPETNVTIRLDARDFKGVQSVDALLKSKDEELTVKMTRVSGSAQYGTWEGVVMLNSSDTTYTLTSATIDNGNTTKTIKVYGQKVYVNYVAPSGDLLTGNVVATGESDSKAKITTLLKNPSMPLTVGLVGMGVALLIVLGTFLRRDKQ